MIDPDLIVSCSANGVCSTVHAVLFSLLVFATLMGGFAYATWLERRLVARIQHRVGPNRQGPAGLFQPIADGIKLIFKEDVTPLEADKVIYWVAPFLKVIPALILLAVVPLGPPLLIPWLDGLWYEVPLGIADVNIGVLWLLAITSVGTYGVVLAGWSSGNKYSMLGGLRSSAQMISYELSMGLGMVVPLMIVGSMSINDIVQAQAYPAFGLGWFVWQNPLAAALLMIALLAEVNRSPFDMPEAEAELVGGYHTEYSGMKFAMFFAAEYIGMIAISAIAASMFFGGYHWPLPADFAPIFGPVNMFIKIVAGLSGMVWIRATLPRIRYDHLMYLGWKVLFPLSLLAVAWSALTITVGELFDDPTTYAVVSGMVMGLVVLVILTALWRRDVETTAQRPDMTDSRTSLGWIIIQAVGAILAAPFALYDWLKKQRPGVEDFVTTMQERREAAQVAAAAGEGGDLPAPGAADGDEDEA
ncbi:MAG: NADH-quinone oxidoreductase subunit NuoH [Anaerolineae bacterium]|nr:NADH-quinone oxidoreductase subunit NuoH [Anaerolineae bacterium]